MKKLTPVLKNQTCLGLLLLSLVAHPLKADDRPHVKEMRARAFKQTLEMSDELKGQYMKANHLLADINLAQLALELGMKEKAATELEDAQRIANELAKSTPVFQSTQSLKIGKIAYSTEKQKRAFYAPLHNDMFIARDKKAFYVPLHNDMFIERDYKPVFSALSKPRFEENDVRIKNVSVSIDLRNVQNEIVQAKQAIARNKVEDAISILHKTLNNAMVSEVEIEAPALAIYDNLALAKNFARHKSYQSARLALRTAKEELAKFEKEGAITPGSAQTAKLSKDIEKLQADLEARDPSTLSRIESEISSWMKTVKSWI